MSLATPPHTRGVINVGSPRPSRERRLERQKDMKERWARKWALPGRSPGLAGSPTTQSPRPLRKRSMKRRHLVFSPALGRTGAAVLIGSPLSDENRRPGRSPVRRTGTELRTSPSASRNREAGPRRGVKRRAGSLERSPHRSPTITALRAPKLDARWSVSGAPLSGGREGLNPRFRHLPRLRTGAETETGSGVEGGQGGAGLSIRRRLFRPRKSLTLFHFSTGVKKGPLSSRTSVEISFPYLAQQCELCVAQLDTAAVCCKHLAMVHGLRRSTLLCSRCGISKSRMHQIECHAAICKNESTATVQGVKCTLCCRSFKSGRGVSIHMRSAHTEEYVAQQRDKAGGQRAQGRKYALWSVEETRLLRALIAKKVKGDFIGAACAVLPDRTIGQIRYKVRQLGKLAQAPVTPDNITMIDNELQELTEVVQRVPLYTLSTARKKILKALAKNPGSGCDGWARVPTESETLAALVDLANVVKLPFELTGSKLGKRQGMGRRITDRRAANAPALNYIRLQKLFKLCRSKAAHMVLNGIQCGVCPIRVRTVTEYFKSKWESEDCYLGLGRFGSFAPCNNRLLSRPITPALVLKTRKCIKISSAAGPDGVNRIGLVRWDPKGEKLASMFNGFLLRGSIPASLKLSRTTLLPKSKDPTDRESVANWRPITIGSMVLRLLSSILHKRLAEACPTHVRQKGFVKSPGCSENLCLVEGALKLSKREGKPLAMVFIDLAKAFDSVSHKHIRRVLSDRCVDQAIIDLIMDCYDGCSTRVRTGQGFTAKIFMRIGVKQGDPLSPLLFNLAIDPLLSKLENFGEGYGDAGNSMAVLAYADDLVLLSDSWDGMYRNIGILEAFCGLSGLKVNSAKCHGFFIAGGMRTANKINNCPPWKLGGAEIHMVGPKEHVRYLGVDINPWKGVRKPDTVGELEALGSRIAGAPLKPSQKFEMLRTFAIPRIMYGAIHASVSQSVLLRADLVIRRLIKAWLHLNPSTTNGLLYSRNVDGGLGVPCLSRSVPLCRSRRIFGLYHSSDGATSEMARGVINPRDFELSWVRGGGSEDQLPLALADLLDPECESFPAPDGWREAEFTKWTGLRPQGFGVELFKNDKISNSWLMGHGRAWWKESHFIVALQMRASVLPTLEFRHRGAGLGFTPPCRACGLGPETSSHILGGCTETKLNRMARHNRICNLLAAVGRGKQWSVMQERRITSLSGKWGVPDLVFLRGSTLLVVDVTVRCEGDLEWLVQARIEKESKYSPFLPALALEFPLVTSLTTHGFVMGVRGKWLTSNNLIVEALGMSKKGTVRFAKTCSRTTILKSVDVYQAFNKQVRGKVIPTDL